ncbi:MAG: ABC transporter ATP-binding protein [Rhizobiaceae bacterium]
MDKPVLSMRNIHRTYGKDEHALTILQGAELDIHRGELVALVAPSGAGKSTLLHLAGLLEKPTSGSLFIGDVECGSLNDDKRTAMRRTDIGFVYQFHHLLPELDARENISLPLLVAGSGRDQANARADELLTHLGISSRSSHRPSELSGGEQQRVAIARAVACQPRLLLADEPTGNLDPSTSELVFEALTSLVRSTGLAALIATHNHTLAAQMDKTVTIEDGKIVPLKL